MAPRFDTGLLIEGINADPRRLLDAVLDEVRKVEANERRSGHNIRFRRKGSFSIALNESRRGSWVDFDSSGTGRDRGNWRRLSGVLDCVLLDIADRR